MNNTKQVTCVPRDWPMQKDYWDSLMYNINNARKVAIIDRCFVSELVYRCIKNDKHRNISLKDALELLDKPYIKIIYCHTDNAYEFAKLRGEDYIETSEEAAEIENLYKYLMLLFKKFNVAKIIEFDWQKDDLKTLINEIRNGN
jgi:hypothetical protein